MSQGCIKKVFDLHIEAIDCQTMAIEDQSEWQNGIKSNYTVLFKIPSTGFEKEIEIDPTKRNLFDSISLFGTTDKKCLSDMLICFTANSCGMKYTIYRAFLCQIECAILQQLAKEGESSEFSDYLELKNLTEALKINIRIGKIKTANILMEKIKSKINHLRCEYC